MLVHFTIGRSFDSIPRTHEFTTGFFDHLIRKSHVSVYETKQGAQKGIITLFGAFLLKREVQHYI